MNFLPIYTRRQFLAAVGAGMGGLVLHPSCLQAADRVRRELNFIVITDTHLGRLNTDAAKLLWWKTAAEVDAAPGAFVLHLGDVVDGGREAQYPVYLEGRKLEEKKAPGYNLPDFRPGYTLVRMRDGAMELQFSVAGEESRVGKNLSLLSA